MTKTTIKMLRPLRNLAALETAVYHQTHLATIQMLETKVADPTRYRAMILPQQARVEEW